MPETIGEAYLQIKPSMEGITGELETAMNGLGSAGASSFGSGFSKTLATAGKVGAAAVGATVAATGALVGNLVSSTSALAEYGDNIDKMSQKMGISAQAYQEWEAVMQHSGTSMETLKASMKTMANAVDSGNEAFARLGISEEEVATLSQEDLFSKVISGLQEMGEGTERTYLAGQLLGRGATELGALLNTSAADTEAMKQAVHDLGGVLSDDTVKAAAGFQDSLQDMQTAISGFTRGAVANFLPELTAMMNGISEIMTGNTEEGLATIQEGIDGFINNLTSNLPKVMEVGMGIISALAGALLDNLPMIVETGLQIILSIANGIIDNLADIIPAIVDVVLTIVEKLTDTDTVTQLLDASLKIMIALAEGLIKALPKLIEKAPIIIANLVIGLVQAFPQIVAAAGELIKAFISGIVGVLKSVAEVGYTIITAIKTAISEKFQEAKNWGKDLIENFVAGIREKIQAVKDVVSNVAQTVKDFLGFSEPDFGPLANFHTFAPDMMKSFSDGIKQNISLVTGAVDQVASSISGEMAMDSSLSGRTPAVQLTGSENGSTPMTADAGNITIPVYIGSELIDQIVINAQQRANYRSGGR